MFTKGFSLVETLLALALSSLVFISALSCHWFARRSYQVTLEQMLATHLLIDITHSVDVQQMAGQPPLSNSYTGCSGCDAMTLQSLQAAATLLRQPVANDLRDVQLCVTKSSTSFIVSLSWRSSVTPAILQTSSCGGNGRRQIKLDIP